MTFAELLRASSMALYGRESAPDIGRLLEVNERTARRWLSGSHEPRDPCATMADIEAVMGYRVEELKKARVESILWRRANEPGDET